MTAPSARQAAGSNAETFAAFLRTELAPYPGRFDALLRYALCIPLVMLLTFYLQLPFLDLAVIIIFFTLMENTLLTYIACAFVIGGTLAVALIDNLFLGLTIDYPLIRIALSSLLVFLGMYLLRAGPVIGVLGYMWSLCVIFLQSNMPLLPDGEMMLRLNLWSSMVTVYTAVLVCIVSALVRRDFPSRSLPKEMARQLRDVAAVLDALLAGKTPPPLSPGMAERDLARLHRLLEFAAIEKKTIKREKTRHLTRIATVDRLHLAAVRLSQLPPDGTGPELHAPLAAIRAACLDFANAVEADVPFRLPEPLPPLPDTGTQLGGELREIHEALSALSSVADTVYPPFEGAKIPLLKPDAATNPAYIHFAAKTVLATLICLGFYKGTQWEGIHTCMLTCIIVAQPSLGATAQKTLLRISGCLVGSAATLLVTIFCIPHITDVTWFILLSLAVLLPAAWIALGSPRSNYAGMQIAFAYALALLTSSGPTVNLTEIRDRLIGILIGAVVSTAVHTLIWPEKEEGSLRQSMAALLRSAAAMAAAGEAPTGEERQARLRDAESGAWNLLAKCREIQTRVMLEPSLTAGQRAFAARSRQWLNEAQDMLFALHARLAAEGRVPPGVAAALTAQADGLAAGAAPGTPIFSPVLAVEKPLEGTTI